MSEILAPMMLQTRESFPAIANTPLESVQVADEAGFAYLDGDIDFGAIGRNEIFQNIKYIVLTEYFSVPLDREFGMSYSMVDKPMRVAEAVLTQEVATKISLYEPRAQFREINFGEDWLNGKLSPEVRVVILTTNELPSRLLMPVTTAATAPATQIATAFDFPSFYEMLISLAKTPGPQGPTGPQGLRGIPGPSTISVGTTATGGPGTDANVVNVGTLEDLVLNFTIPEGDIGASGPEGPIGPEGPEGPAGPTGATGATGATGPQGPPGPDPPVLSVAGKIGAVTLVKGDVGLGSVDNTSDASKPVSTAQQTALDAKQATSAKGAANGYAGLDSGSRVPAAQLPSTVEYNSNKGIANGYASLDSGGKVPVAQLPFAGVTILTGTLSHNPGSVASNGDLTFNITVTGAVTTNTPSVAIGTSIQYPQWFIISSARVSAANTVEVNCRNVGGAAVDLALHTVRATVFQF